MKPKVLTYLYDTRTHQVSMLFFNPTQSSKCVHIANGPEFGWVRSQADDPLRQLEGLQMKTGVQQIWIGLGWWTNRWYLLQNSQPDYYPCDCTIGYRQRSSWLDHHHPPRRGKLFGMDLEWTHWGCWAGMRLSEDMGSDRFPFPAFWYSVAWGHHWSENIWHWQMVDVPFMLDPTSLSDCQADCQEEMTVEVSEQCNL